MKTKLLLSALLMLCLSTFVHAQGNLPPWLIELAPDKEHVLFSGPGGVYDHAKLDSLIALYKERTAWYHYPGSNNSYSLPLDTLEKYEILMITMRHSTGLSPTLSLPAFPVDDDKYNGKTIVIHFEASEVLDTIFVEAIGPSQLVQLDCYDSGKTTHRDTILANQYNPDLIVYRTSYQDDYVRQCEKEDHNYGQVLYVDETQGAASDSAVGSLTQTYALLDNALSDVTDGQGIKVLSGNQTISGQTNTTAGFFLDAETGSDITVTNTSFPAFNVLTNSRFNFDKITGVGTGLISSQDFSNYLIFKANYLDFTGASNNGNAIITVTSNADIDVGFIKDCVTHGFLMLSPTANNTASTVPVHNIKVGAWELTNKAVSLAGSLVWYYGDLTGSATDGITMVSNVEIGSLAENYTANSSTFYIFSYGARTDRQLRNASINNKVGSWYSKVTRVIPSWDSSIGIGIPEIAVFGEVVESSINVEVGSVIANRFISGFGTSQALIRATDFTIKIGTSRTQDRILDLVDHVRIVDSSTFNLVCESCVVTDDVAIKALDFDIYSSDSKVTISGNYKVSGSYPVIYTDETLYLKDVTLENDGTTPVVSAPNPVTVYVSGAFDIGNSPLDPDVTFVRLEELGDPSFEISITGAATNGSGDITVPHSLGTADINVNVTARGTALRHFTVHSKTAADFTVRFYDSSGTPLGAGTNMDFDVQAKKQ